MAYNTSYAAGADALGFRKFDAQGAVVACGLLTLLLVIYHVLVAGKKLPLPPGPKGLPLIGVALEMPADRPWVRMAEWARSYGPLMHLRIGAQQVIVVSSGDIAREMLDNRHKIYSSRPPSLPGEIVTRNMRSVLLPYGDHLKRVRRSYTKFISARKCDGYLPIQEGEAIASIKDISLHPDKFVQCILRYSLSTARSIAFGKRVQDFNDPFAKDVKQLMEQFSEIMQPGKYLFDSFPMLQLLPRVFRPWMDHLEDYRDWETKFFLREYRTALKEAELYPNRPSAARDICEEAKALGDDNELQAANTCMEILGTGSDTTGGSLVALIHACLAFPEVLEKAHEELDRVIGRDRFPNWEDEPDLPYIRAMVKEQHRWRTIAPLSFSHIASQEDVINGYRIPKNALIHINTWAMHMDPKRYPEPDKYIPERFLGHKHSASAYANSTDVNARDHFSYGGGRRICVGIHLAERSLFNMVSRLLHTFDIRRALDENGDEIPVDVNAYTTGLMSFPKPFQARFIIRSEEIRKTLDREWGKLFGNGPVESWIS